jgi:hypothetical protein
MSPVSLRGCAILTDCSGCLVLSHLSCPCVLSRRYCPSCPVPFPLSPANLSRQSGPCCHVQAFHPTASALSWLSCQGFLVSALLPQHSSAQLFCLCCPVFVVMFSWSCSICSCPTCPALGVLSWIFYPDFPVLAVQGCPYMADQKLKN